MEILLVFKKCGNEYGVQFACLIPLSLEIVFCLEDLL